MGGGNPVAQLPQPAGLSREELKTCLDKSN